LGWAKRGGDEGEGETNRDFAHGGFLFARGKDGFSAKKKFTPRMEWFVRGQVKLVDSHPFRKVIKRWFFDSATLRSE
jgi:hypothetical protein